MESKRNKDNPPHLFIVKILNEVNVSLVKSKYKEKMKNN